MSKTTYYMLRVDERPVEWFTHTLDWTVSCLFNYEDLDEVWHCGDMLALGVL